MRFIMSAIAIACLTTANATAADYKVGSMEITAAWSRATPKGAATAVGYMTIKNNGTTPDRLIGGSAEFADKFELHSMTMENGISKMRALKGVDIKPGESIQFKPGSTHIMFVGIKYPLSKGEHINGTLVFENAGKVQIEYSVEGIGARIGPADMEHMQH